MHTTPNYTTLCRNSDCEGIYYSNLTFSQLFAGKQDLRTSFPELKEFPQELKPSDVVIDSAMSLHQAFQGFSARCPDEVLAKQQLLRVFYFGADDKLHQGQLVIHDALVNDIAELFRMLRLERIPIGSVIPMSENKFNKDGTWDDYLSMEANNSSAFNYRDTITADGKQEKLSLHALGLALDINPMWNPCYGSPVVHQVDRYAREAAAGYKTKLPPNGEYSFENPGSFHNRHPVVLFLQSRGWQWGGEWGNPKDLHHFVKVPPEIKDEVDRLRGS